MKEREIAVKIVEQLKQHTAPGKSTWGDQFSDAHEDLFKHYTEDMVEDIIRVLRGGK